MTSSTIGPSQSYADTSGSNTSTATTESDFDAAVLQALMARGVDPNKMDPTQLQMLIESVWNDQAIQDLAGAEASGKIGAFGVTVSMSELQTAISRVMFDPSMSDNPGLLQTGLSIMESQNLPLNSSQAAFLATGAQGAGGSSGYLADLARGAGWPEELVPTIVAIVMAESGGNPTALNDNPGVEYSVGLAQINVLAHEDLAQKYNLDDPLQNLKAALQVYQNAGNSFSPWSTFTNGAYQQFMGAGKGPYVSTNPNSTASKLETQFSQLVSVYASFTGHKPSEQELLNLVSAGYTPDSLTQYLRGQSSYIPGLTVGGYEDLRATADKISNSLFGHGVTDGMIAELQNAGMTGPSEINLYLLNMDAQGKMDPKTYQKLAAANRGALDGVYNQGANFDPRIANQQHDKAVQAGILAAQEKAVNERAWADYRRLLADNQPQDINLGPHPLPGPEIPQPTPPPAPPPSLQKPNVGQGGI